MNYKLVNYVFLIVAAVVAILSLISPNTFAIAALTSHVFEVMLPVLGAAALFKYLFWCDQSCKTSYSVIFYALLVIAVLVGILSLVNPSTFAIAALTSRFFAMMLPVLGFAALCKYLLCMKDCRQ